jgi:hypothetical protein
MKLRPRLLALLMALALGFAAAGCGGDNKSESESESAGGETMIDCRGDAFSGDPKLPANFPQPGELVITNSTTEGPTQVVTGYWESGLDEAYREWKDQVEEAGFKVTFDELEEKDSEVAYEGEGKTGIIQLKDRCNEDEVTYVRITVRPE